MFFVTLQVQRYNIFMRFAIGFRGRFYDFCELRLFNRVCFGIICWGSEHYTFIQWRGKTTKTAHIPIKTVPDIAPGTQWWEENHTCMIFLSHASAEAPTATCAIICLSLLKQAVFTIVPIYCSIQFTFEMPICFSQRCLKWRLYIATRRVLGRLWSNISHSNTFEPKFERRKKKE